MIEIDIINNHVTEIVITDIDQNQTHIQIPEHLKAIIHDIHHIHIHMVPIVVVEEAEDIHQEEDHHLMYHQDLLIYLHHEVEVEGEVLFPIIHTTEHQEIMNEIDINNKETVIVNIIIDHQNIPILIHIKTKNLSIQSHQNQIIFMKIETETEKERVIESKNNNHQQEMIVINLEGI